MKKSVGNGMKKTEATVDTTRRAEESGRASSTPRWLVPLFVLMQEDETVSAFVDKHLRKLRAGAAVIEKVQS